MPRSCGAASGERGGGSRHPWPPAALQGARRAGVAGLSAASPRERTEAAHPLSAWARRPAGGGVRAAGARRGGCAVPPSPCAACSPLGQGSLAGPFGKVPKRPPGAPAPRRRSSGAAVRPVLGSRPGRATPQGRSLAAGPRLAGLCGEGGRRQLLEVFLGFV